MATFVLTKTRWPSDDLSEEINGARHIASAEKCEHYEIEFNTMDELLQFIKDNGGKVVIEFEVYYNPMPTIEIYNGYRE